jgi:hypothetical protein
VLVLVWSAGLTDSDAPWKRDNAALPSTPPPAPAPFPAPPAAGGGPPCAPPAPAPAVSETSSETVQNSIAPSSKVACVVKKGRDVSG